MRMPSRNTIAASAALLKTNSQVNQAAADVRAPVERAFDVPGLRLAAREWGASGGTPVIALHGWLDNAGSFDLIAPQLRNVHLIALDCAGHGHSGHRSPDAGYNVWQDVPELFAVADQLGWERFSLLGHSRGAGIASIAAGTLPERINALVMIDGGVPVPGDPAEVPAQFAKSVLRRDTLRRDRGRVWASREEAIAERARGFTKITLDAADILARRSLRPVEGGYSWFVDQRLKIESELRLSPEQITAFMRAVAAPSFALVASDSPLTKRPGYLELLREIPGVEIVELAGGHHLHLEDAAEDIARRIQQFLAALD